MRRLSLIAVLAVALTAVMQPMPAHAYGQGVLTIGCEAMLAWPGIGGPGPACGAGNGNANDLPTDGVAVFTGAGVNDAGAPYVLPGIGGAVLGVAAYGSQCDVAGVPLPVPTPSYLVGAMALAFPAGDVVNASYDALIVGTAVVILLTTSPLVEVDPVGPATDGGGLFGALAGQFIIKTVPLGTCAAPDPFTEISIVASGTYSLIG